MVLTPRVSFVICRRISDFGGPEAPRDVEVCWREKWDEAADKQNNNTRMTAAQIITFRT